MLVKTLLAGTYTWPGGTDAAPVVTTGDTSDVVVGDYVKREENDELYWKVTVVTTNVSITLDNPDVLTIPTGTPNTAYKTEEGVRDDILAAGDVAQVDLMEVVTQPNDPATIPVNLAGTWTFDGTTNVAVSGVDATTVVSVGEWIHLTADSTKVFKATVVVAAAVTIEDPNALGIPSGTGATKCLVRQVKDKHSSATVQVGKTYEAVPTYINPVSDKAWGGASDMVENIV